MSAAPVEIRIGAELVSAPYLLDAAAAKLYHDGIEGRLVVARRAESTTTRTPRARRGSSRRSPRRTDYRNSRAISRRQLRDALRARRTYRMSLTKPVLFGDTLTSHAKIVSVDANTNRAELEIHVENQRGEQVLTAPPP